MNLIYTALIIQLIVPLAAVFIKNQKIYSAAAHILLICGLTGMLAVILPALINPDFITAGAKSILSTDQLSLYFLLVITLAAVPTTIYSYSYLDHYLTEGRPVKGFIVFYSLLLVSTQLVVLSNHAILFLVCWEVMSTSAFLGIIFEKEKSDVVKGGLYYLFISHAAAFILYITFLLLHRQSQSWLFSDFRVDGTAPALLLIIYLLSFIGFGMKAGIMPFHFWLPKAHPVAPTVLSAFLSGIIIKTGIYGILRTFNFLSAPPEWFAWVVFVLGIISAIFGVWYALAQHDIKRLLAYHSVENIGIIVIGIGLGLIGKVHNIPAIQVLGFGGALLHTLNHAVFKSLLFAGSGVIYRNTGTRNIELMGGIIQKSRYFVLLFLLGSAAISGIPPFNGFISEFIIYTGFFNTAKQLAGNYPFYMLLGTVALALTGGLAIACFTKINSIMFLGTARTPLKKFFVSKYEYISLSLFALLCLVIGIIPYPFTGVVNKVVQSSLIPGKHPAELVNINWVLMTAVFSSILAGFGLIYYWKKYRQRKFGRRIEAPWGCGYVPVESEKSFPSRTQYTASSFADELNLIPRSVILYKKRITAPKSIFPAEAAFHSQSSDLVDKKMLLPLFRFLNRKLSAVKFLSYTDVRYSVAFILFVITIYTVIAFLWK